MSFSEDFARYLDAQRRKNAQPGFYVGTVQSLAPLTISILDGAVMVHGPFLTVSETVQRLIDPLPDCCFNGCECGGSCTHECFPPRLKVGDRVILMGSSRFAAIDRLGGTS